MFAASTLDAWRRRPGASRPGRLNWTGRRLAGMTARFARDPRISGCWCSGRRRRALERFQPDFPDAAAVAGAETLCQRADVDLIYIGTPNRFHSEHARLAAENRKHVLIEKPMTITLADADEMIATAERLMACCSG